MLRQIVRNRGLDIGHLLVHGVSARLDIGGVVVKHIWGDIPRHRHLDVHRPRHRHRHGHRPRHRHGHRYVDALHHLHSPHILLLFVLGKLVVSPPSHFHRISNRGVVKHHIEVHLVVVVVFYLVNINVFQFFSKWLYNIINDIYIILSTIYNGHINIRHT